MKKFLAVCLAALLLTQTFAIGAAAVTLDTEADYTGAILAAVNTNYDDLTQTFTAKPKTPANANGKTAGSHFIGSRGNREEALLCGEEDELPEPLSPAEAAKKQAALGGNGAQAKPAEYHVGDLKTIHSSYRTEFPSNNVLMECIYIGEYCTVWNEVDRGFSVEKSVKLGKDFDEMVVREFEIFGGNRIDTDGDGKTALFVQGLDSSYGGYFSVSDLVDSLGRIGNVWFRYKGSGNACDCVHMNGPYLSTLAHEFQHYLQRCWQFYGKNNFTYVPNTLESYINEGFSECASYLLLGTNTRVWWFEDAISDPENYSLLNWSFDSAAYATSYVFCQYLRTSYAQIPGVEDGAEIYKTIMNIRANKRVKNTLSIAADLLYPESLYPELKTTDSRCRQLLVDFWLAVLCKESKGRQGFLGEAWADPIEAPVQNELPEDGSRGIRSGMAAYYYTRTSFNDTDDSGTVCVTKAGKDMVFVGVSGVGCKVTYNWNNGVWENETYYRIQDTETLKWPDSYFPGKAFLGWSTDPNAVTATYAPGRTIYLSRIGETVLYAVWDNARALPLSETVTIEKTGREYCCRFVPETDGYYILTAPYGTNIDLFDNGELVWRVWTDWFEDGSGGASWQECYRLTAGKPYDIYVTAIRGNSPLRMDYAEQQYTLRYYAELEGSRELAIEVGGKDVFEISRIEASDAGGFIASALTRGVEFAGWAFSPEAKTADLKPFDLFRPEKDTDLYAVWQPVTVMPEQGSLTLDYETYHAGRPFAFTPKTGGTYEFSAAASDQEKTNIRACSYLEIFDGSGRQLLELEPEQGTVTLSLQGGKTYIFYTFFSESDVASAANISLKKVSDKSSARLIFNFKSANNKRDYQLIMRDRFVYKIPGLTPINTEAGAFTGWSYQGGSCRAGDEFEPIVDTEFFPEWERPQKTGKFVTFMRGIAQGIRFAVQFIVVLLSGRVDFVKI